MNSGRNTDVVALLRDLREIIDTARGSISVSVNSQITMLYWQVGSRVRSEVLRDQRAEYGKRILATVSQELQTCYGKGFSPSALTRMIRFSELYPDSDRVNALSKQLSWSHIIGILPFADPNQREFYLQMCCIERWSVRRLRKQIDAHLYERTGLSRGSREQIRESLERLKTDGELTPDFLLKDPYILDFLGLQDRYVEKDVEDAILRDMEGFLLELGAGFSFIDRQYRITVDDDDFYIDLLFYNRLLRRLVVIELKLDDFKPAYKGQMELYLRWLDKYQRREGEEAPIGLILCAGKKSEQIELLELDKAGIHVAEYVTEFPPRDLLERKFQTAVRDAKARLGDHSDQ